MSRKYFSVVTGKDNFLANIQNEETALTLSQDEQGREFVTGLNGVLVLHNIAMLLPNGKNVGILPFKDLAFGAEYVSVPAEAISGIYLVTEDLAIQIRAALSGIVAAK